MTLAGPVDVLERLGARQWNPRVRIVNWTGGRYSLRAELEWDQVRKDVGDSLWYFPHWDVPWHHRPRRYVVTVHDVGHLQIPDVSRARRGLARYWMHRSVDAALSVTTVTTFTAKELSATWPQFSSKIHVLPNGVDSLFFDAPSDVSIDAALPMMSRPFMLSVGIRKRHKNLAIGVDVLVRIPRLRWVIIGEWFPDWQAVESRAHEMGVAERIIVLDRQSESALNTLYHTAGCLFFPSRYEGFGLPIVEALAAGTPVITSTAAGSVETLGGCGWVCDPNDPDGFAQAVNETLLLGESRAAVAARGRARAREFSWEKGADHLADILRGAA